MRFWELQSLVRRQPEVIREIGSSSADWAPFARWSEDFAALVDGQDRAKLDCELPDAFCRAVIGRLDLPYYLSDGFLRSYRISKADRVLTALEAYDLIGGTAMEDVQEKGRWPTGELQ